MMVVDPTTWTTEGGVEIPIRWMQSAHLVHAYNMILRKNALTHRRVFLRSQGKIRDALHFLDKEIVDRELRVEDSDFSYAVPKLRETPAQLCLLRAIIDTEYLGFLQKFKDGPQAMLDHLSQNPTEFPRLTAKFAEYRLERA